MSATKETSNLEAALRKHVEVLRMKINDLDDEAAEIETKRTALVNTQQTLIDILTKNGNAQ